MSDRILLDIGRKFSNNEYIKIIEIINIFFKEKGYKDTYLSYYINCLIKLGLFELAIKNLKLMLKLFPNFYTPLNLACLYIDLNMLDELEQLLKKNKFNDRCIYTLAKRCYFNTHHDLSHKLFTKFLEMSKDKLYIERAKEYLRKLEIYKHDKDVFVEICYSQFKAQGRQLSSQHIIYTSKIRDDYFENQYNDDPKRQTRPYMIWKIEGDKIFCFPITTKITRSDSGKRNYALYGQNYKTRNFDRLIKNNLVVIQENDVESVIDRVNDRDFEIIIKQIYNDICFQHDILKKHNAYFIETLSSQFKPKLFDVIKVPFHDNNGHTHCKAYLILEIDLKKGRYKVVEIDLTNEEIEIVNYALSYVSMKTPIISIEEIEVERKNKLLEKVPSNFKNVNMIGTIIESENKNLEILLEQDGIFICIDKTFNASCSYVAIDFVDRNDPLYVKKRITPEEYKTHLETIKDYMKNHSAEVFRRKKEFITLQRNKQRNKF